MRRAHLTNARSLAAVLVASSLLLAGCGGGSDDSSGDPSPASQSVAGSSEVASTWPLTGLPVTGDESAEKSYPVLVTKMDNTVASQPQLGLGQADMVVEELVEGGLTRLAAFYYSQLPTKVGPVRSMRASDVGVVSPVHASIVTSGAAAPTIAIIRHAGIKYYPEGTNGIARDDSRSAPYNLFADLQTVAKDAKQSTARPENYLQWGTDADFPGGQQAKTIAAIFGGGHTTDWTYNGKGYVNTNSNADADDQFPADNVLVLRVQEGDAGYLDPAGNPVPKTLFSGKGKMMLFHGGKVLRGSWAKPALDAPLTLSTVAGSVKVPAGHTWIELVPAATGNVTFTK